MTEVSITTKPKLRKAVIEFWQGEKLVHKDRLTAGGAYTADIDFEPEAVRVKIGDSIETNQQPRDLKGLRFLTRVKAAVPLEELNRRWRRAQVGLPKDYLEPGQTGVTEEELLRRKNSIMRKISKQ